MWSVVKSTGLALSISIALTGAYAVAYWFALRWLAVP